MNEQELEVKFFVNNLAAIAKRLEALGAEVEQPRQAESNLRFDTPSGELKQRSQVLRLRQDNAARLTYKGPAHAENGVQVRQEIEFVVSDFQTARHFLEALGYQVSMLYEKYRATYSLAGLHVTLDEMPYGNFVEVEGYDTDTIQRVSSQLGLNWDRRVQISYSQLFDRLRATLNLPFRDLSFENFRDFHPVPQELGVQPADEAAFQAR